MQIRVQFDGGFPNLCSGRLVIIIDEEVWEFPSYCLNSGGGASLSNLGIWHGEWDISKWPENFPEELKEVVLEAVNEQVPHGCCGGCLQSRYDRNHKIIGPLINGTVGSLFQ